MRDVFTHKRITSRSDPRISSIVRRTLTVNLAKNFGARRNWRNFSVMSF